MTHTPTAAVAAVHQCHAADCSAPFAATQFRTGRMPPTTSAAETWVFDLFLNTSESAISAATAAAKWLLAPDQQHQQQQSIHWRCAAATTETSAVRVTP